MPDKIVVGPINKGLRSDRTAFVIDNDSFPTLINAYQWRGRVKRKRGTSLLNRLKRFFNSTSTSYNSGTTTITLNGSGVGNILFGFSLSGSLVPGSVTITAPGPAVYTDPAVDGTLSPSGSINYASGEITILAEAGNAVSVTFNYYPTLPVMGIEDLTLESTLYPQTLCFDTKYSYFVQGTQPFNTYDVSFYKNPAASASLPGYVQKVNPTPTSWNGQDYQQFWTTNYQGALWATNGINIPFDATSIGMQYKNIANVTMIVAGPPASARLTITGHGLSVGDFLFINEVGGVTGINYQTGYVTNVAGVDDVDVTFPNATLGGAYTSGGLAQYLTNRADTTKDCLRFYDGDPTNGNAALPTLSGVNGWVNFAPPLSRGLFSISDLPPLQYYLVGARMILQFKDRLCFFGPVVQANGGAAIYLQDTVIYSQNGTPYYTSSFTYSAADPTDPTLSTIVFYPILVPVNQTAQAGAYFEDQAGLGGFIAAGYDQPITTVSTNEDVVILGFPTIQSRLVYSGNDIIPFNFYVINSELGSASTFSAINMDRGVISQGNRGFVITGQTEVQRVDLPIPDEVFQINLENNGIERVCAQRDYINEWIYFNYPSNSFNLKFPTQTLLYNYRDDSWAVFLESYTTYGSFRKRSGYTWATIDELYPTWADWNDPWNAGTTTLLQPNVLGGTSQGFLIVTDDGTNEANSVAIQSISGSVITSPGHAIPSDTYITISGALGTIASEINGKIFSVTAIDQDTFSLNPPIGSGTYLGGGLIKRMYVPLIQTKQFPTAWGMGRKTRLGAQQYLLTKTSNSQITLLIYLSQNSDSAYNTGFIVPELNSINNSLIYSTVLYTCPESTNLGLTPANVNLQMPTATAQSQIWHRMNTSLIGDTVQVGFTLSDTQMRNSDFAYQFSEIELHGFIMDVYPAQLLC